MIDVYAGVKEFGLNINTGVFFLGTTVLAFLFPWFLRLLLSISMLVNVTLLWSPSGMNYGKGSYRADGSRVNFEEYMANYHLDLWWVQLGYAAIVIYIFLPIFVSEVQRIRLRSTTLGAFIAGILGLGFA